MKFFKTLEQLVGYHYYPLARMSVPVWRARLALKESLGPDEEEHECLFGDVDVDLCTACGEHADFCEECGSTCCGANPVCTDYDDIDR